MYKLDVIITTHKNILNKIKNHNIDSCKIDIFLQLLQKYKDKFLPAHSDGVDKILFKIQFDSVTGAISGLRREGCALCIYKYRRIRIRRPKGGRGRHAV